MADVREFSLFESPLSGRNLIEASAGTGKTFTIAHIYLRLLLEKPIQVENILVVTFTRAATNELKDRIQELLLQAREAFLHGKAENKSLDAYIQRYPNREAALKRLETAVRNFDEAAIFTIDGFCNKVLLENAFESSSLFDTELVTEQEEILRGIVEDWWRTSLLDKSSMFVSYASQKTSPDAFFRLLVDKVGLLYLRIVPEAEAVDCSDFEKAFQHSYQRLLELWPRSREEVAALLSDQASGLNRGVYKKTQIPTWLTEMDLYTSTTDAVPVLPDSFVKFTASTIRSKTKKGKQPIEHPFFEACEAHYQNHVALETAYQQCLIKMKRDLFEYARSELRRRKQELNIYFFDDLRLNLHQALSQNGVDMAQAVREKFKAALIDEFQDTDPVQYEIFQRIFDHKDSILFLIGDPKQAIYGFRGADVFAYMRAKRETPTQYTLSTNYRSTPELIQALNVLFTQAKNGEPFVYSEIPYEKAKPADISRDQCIIANDSGEPLQLWFAEANRYENSKRLYKREAVPIIIDAVADSIAGLLKLGKEKRAHIGDEPVQSKHIAVLVRENRQARALQAKLATVGVHSVLYTTNSLFQTQEAEELARILASVIEPKRTGLLRAALVTETMGMSGNQLYQSLEDEEVLEIWYERMSRYHKIWQNHGFIRMFREMMRECQWLTGLMSYRDGERRLTNLYHLAETLNEIEMTRRLGMSGLLKWLDEKRLANMIPAEEHQLRLESDENAVKLITMHMSKGLQYPIVFCPFTWAGAYVNKQEFTFHDDDDARTFTLELGSKDVDRHEALARIEELAQNLRLLYVAVTRAQHRCYLVWGNFGEMPQSAPGYLLHQPNGMTTDDPLNRLKSHLDNVGDTVLWEELEQIQQKATDSIKLTHLPEPTGNVFSPLPDTPPELACRTFAGKIDVSQRIASYSSLVARMPHGAELPDHDPFEVPLPAETTEEPEPEPTSFLAFPRGAKAGTFVHSLLEDLDFTETDADPIRELIQIKMETFGFDSEWLPAVEGLMKRVQEISVDAESGFHFGQISNTKRLNELEFYFPVKRVTPKELSSVFGDGAIQGRGEIGRKIEELRFEPFRGFMKGFIDLVFEHDSRYYIVDWKSNYLGPQSSDYGTADLVQAMADNLYFLQYHLYTVALDRYLQLRYPEYDYEHNFGGVYYIFLRGLEDASAKSGVFFDRPANNLIAELSETLLADYDDKE